MASFTETVFDKQVGRYHVQIARTVINEHTVGRATALREQMWHVHLDGEDVTYRIPVDHAMDVQTVLKTLFDEIEAGRI